MKLFAQFALSLLLIFPSVSFAEISPQIEADFKVLNGYIIMPIGNEYLVDLDAAADLQIGDILTLVTPGEKVVHPITKEVLGSLDIAKGYLQVTRIKSGYSYATLLTSEVPAQKGDQVRRYEQVPTLFEDKQGDGTQLLQDLKTSLPQLNWLPANSALEPLLVFTLTNNALSVKSASGSQLRNYQVVSGDLVSPAPPRPASVPSTDPSEPKILDKAVKGLINTFIPDSRGRDMAAGEGIIRQNPQNRAGIWLGPPLQGSPVGIAVADLDADGQQETATAMEGTLFIGQINQGKYLQEGKLDMPVGLQILSLDSIDLDNNGQQELYLTAVKDGQLKSMLVEFSEGNYLKLLKDIPWYLRAVELPGEGRKLLGQRLGTDGPGFTGDVFRVERTQDKLTAGDKLNLPSQINLYSFVPFQDQNNKPFFAYLSPTDYLKVANDQGEILWESNDYFGGSETRFDRKKGLQEDIIEPVYIGSRLVKNPAGEILVAQNDGLRTLQRFRMFKDSRLLAMTWNGLSLVENWRTAGQNGYLGDFTLADADNDGALELVMAMKFKHKSILKEARSAIVTYETQ